MRKFIDYSITKDLVQRTKSSEARSQIFDATGRGSGHGSELVEARSFKCNTQFESAKNWPEVGCEINLMAQDGQEARKGGNSKYISFTSVKTCFLAFSRFPGIIPGPIISFCRIQSQGSFSPTSFEPSQLSPYLLRQMSAFAPSTVAFCLLVKIPDYNQWFLYKCIAIVCIMVKPIMFFLLNSIECNENLIEHKYGI